MKRISNLVVLVAVAVSGIGCGSDKTAAPAGPMQSMLIGNWISTGADVAPLLAVAPFNYRTITAQFNADSTLAVTGLDSAGKTTMFASTYTSTPSEVKGMFDIHINQTQPSVVSSDGIYEIDATVTPLRMQYEVVQTQPTNGLQPPTAAAGFGSTVYNGKPIATLIQKFVRQ